MNEIKNNPSVIRVGKGVYELDPADRVREPAPEVNAAQAIPFTTGEESAAVPENGADEKMRTDEFRPVTNPLKVALDNGQIALSDLDPEERAIAERAGKEKSKTAESGRGFFSVFRKGDSLPLFICSLINLGVYIAWLVAYVICVVCREIMMGQAVTQMQMSGTANYIVSINSPLFTVLRMVLYALPVIMLVWTVLIIAVNKKQKQLPDNVIIIGSYAVDFIAGIVAVIDVFAVRILFS